MPAYEKYYSPLSGTEGQQGPAQKQDRGHEDLVHSHVLLSEVAGNASQEDADEDRDSHGHKANGQGYPGSLKHPGKDVPAQVIGAEEIDAPHGDFLGAQGFQIGRRKGRAQFLLEPNKGRIKDGPGSRSEHKPYQRGEEEEDENGKARKGETVSLKEPP